MTRPVPESSESPGFPNSKRSAGKDLHVKREQNKGDARNWEVRTLEVGNPVHSAVLIDDVDRDGKADVILGNYVWLPTGVPSTRRDYLTILHREN